MMKMIKKPVPIPINMYYLLDSQIKYSFQEIILKQID